MSSQRLMICHPAYPIQDNVILRLDCYDHVSARAPERATAVKPLSRAEMATMEKETETQQGSRIEPSPSQTSPPTSHGLPTPHPPATTSTSTNNHPSTPPLPVKKYLGVHAGLAFTAMCVIQGNVQDGFFSPFRDYEKAKTHDTTRLDFNLQNIDTVIVNRQLYWHPSRRHGPTLIADPECKSGLDAYPVVACFKDWIYPHENKDQDVELPITFQNLRRPTPGNSHSSSNEQINIHDRDCGICRLTRTTLATQCCHVIPKDMYQWYVDNGMRRYGRSSSPDPSRDNREPPIGRGVNDVNNLMLLTATMHRAFEVPNFLFNPVLNPSTGERDFIAYLLEPIPEFEIEWHGRLTDGINNPPQFMYARFAWAIFQLIQAFTCCSVHHALLITHRSENGQLTYKLGSSSDRAPRKTTPRSNSSNKNSSTALPVDNQIREADVRIGHDGSSDNESDDSHLESYVTSDGTLESDILAARLNEDIKFWNDVKATEKMMAAGEKEAKEQEEKYWEEVEATEKMMAAGEKEAKEQEEKYWEEVEAFQGFYKAACLDGALSEAKEPEYDAANDVEDT
jgi:hypothetical protein